MRGLCRTLHSPFCLSVVNRQARAAHDQDLVAGGCETTLPEEPASQRQGKGGADARVVDGLSGAHRWPDQTQAARRMRGALDEALALQQGQVILDV